MKIYKVRNSGGTRRDRVQTKEVPYTCHRHRSTMKDIECVITMAMGPIPWRWPLTQEFLRVVEWDLCEKTKVGSYKLILVKKDEGGAKSLREEILVGWNRLSQFVTWDTVYLGLGKSLYPLNIYPMSRAYQSPLLHEEKLWVIDFRVSLLRDSACQLTMEFKIL